MHAAAHALLCIRSRPVRPAVMARGMHIHMHTATHAQARGFTCTYTRLHVHMLADAHVRAREQPAEDGAARQALTAATLTSTTCATAHLILLLPCLPHASCRSTCTCYRSYFCAAPDTVTLPPMYMHATAQTHAHGCTRPRLRHHHPRWLHMHMHAGFARLHRHMHAASHSYTYTCKCTCTRLRMHMQPPPPPLSPSPPPPSALPPSPSPPPPLPARDCTGTYTRLHRHMQLHMHMHAAAHATTLRLHHMCNCLLDLTSALPLSRLMPLDVHLLLMLLLPCPRHRCPPAHVHARGFLFAWMARGEN